MHKEGSQEELGKLPKFKSHFEFRGVKEDKYSQDRILELHRDITLEISRVPMKRLKKNVPSKYKAVANMYFY